MFDIGWTELLVIGVVALIVVGPKDLPGMFRAFGRFTAKVKGMAREFHRAMDQAADEAGAKDIAKDLKTISSAKSMGLDKIKDAASEFGTWEPDRPSADRAMGSETAKLAQQRAEAARKIHDAAARKARDRLDRETMQSATGTQPPPTGRTGAAPAAKKASETRKKTSSPGKAKAAGPPPARPAAKPAVKSSVKRVAPKPKIARNPESETKS